MTTGRMGKHYGFRSHHAWHRIPCTEVVEAIGPTTVGVVKRRYGLTWAHSVERALAWKMKHER